MSPDSTFNPGTGVDDAVDKSEFSLFKQALMAVCEPSEPRYARRQPSPNPGEHHQNHHILVQLPAEPWSCWTGSRQQDIWVSASP
jgi:hypothetical protein